MRRPIVAIGLLLLAGSTLVHADDIVKLEDCPMPVRETIGAHLGGGTIKEIERTTDHGRVLYEVDVIVGDAIMEFDVAEDGTFLLEDDADDDDDGDDADEDDDAEGDDVDGDDGDEEEGAEWDEQARQSAARAGISLTPIADKVAFSSTITHPYLPLSTVRTTELVGDDERVMREVQPDTKLIGGVECLVLAEKEYEDGELTEISYNYFAQDAAGNIYYFGEDVDDYEDGKVVGHGGAWLVGRNAREPCLFMPADLTIGLMFKPENVAPNPQEWDRIDTTCASLRVKAGRYENVLVVAETDVPGRWQERKYYARGIGLISENQDLNLVKIHAYGAPRGHAELRR
jgi:hypothetical protein